MFLHKTETLQTDLRFFLVLKCLVLINNANFELQLLECLSSVLCCMFTDTVFLSVK